MNTFPFFPMTSIVCLVRVHALLYSCFTYAIAAGPLLVVVACGIDEGLKGRVLYHITVAFWSRLTDKGNLQSDHCSLVLTLNLRSWRSQCHYTTASKTLFVFYVRQVKRVNSSNVTVNTVSYE